MPTYRAFQVTGQRQFELVEREVVDPEPGHVRVRVLACGVCHSDFLGVEGVRPDPGQPMVPGHEIIGVVDAVGPGVNTWNVGERVGLGFLGGHCGECAQCQRGDFVNCLNQPQPGTSEDGGYADIVYARATGLVRVPESMNPIEAAPLLCAGITTFNALRNSGARPGDVVAVLGLGGLGHLGVQYAAKCGFKTVAIARGKDKEPLARQLGAAIYIDSQSQDPAAELQKLGGANVILSTVTVGDAMSAVQGGLAIKGTMIVIGAAESLQLSPIVLLMGNRSVKGWYSGTAIDSQDTLAFSALSGVRPMIETMPSGQGVNSLLSFSKHPVEPPSTYSCNSR